MRAGRLGPSVAVVTDSRDYDARETGLRKGAEQCFCAAVGGRVAAARRSGSPGAPLEDGASTSKFHPERAAGRAGSLTQQHRGSCRRRHNLREAHLRSGESRVESCAKGSYWQHRAAVEDGRGEGFWGSGPLRATLGRGSINQRRQSRGPPGETDGTPAEQSRGLAHSRVKPESSSRG